MIAFSKDTQLIISNYSPTEIEIISFFGDSRYLIAKEALVASALDEYTIQIKSSLDSANIIKWVIIANNVISPTFSTNQELINIINGWANSSHEISVNGANSVGMLNTLNFVEGTNITITTNYDATNNVTDVQIDASGGGGGLPPDGTYGDIVVSSSGTIWTVTDDTSNQQVAVYEDAFLRGTRPALNFYDDGGLVSITVADDSPNNRVNIGISSSGIGSTGFEQSFLLMGG